MSQRRLAHFAGLSYKTIQLLESAKHDPQLSTLNRIASSLGYPRRIVEERVKSLFSHPEDSVIFISYRMGKNKNAWKTWLFNFVDAFRENPVREFIENPPDEKSSLKVKALIASTVEALCVEMQISPPPWCQGVEPLQDPWFVADMESLKPLALVESPVHFRKRNIFVLENFMERR